MTKAWMVLILVFSPGDQDTKVFPLDLHYSTVEECDTNAKSFLEFTGPDLLQQFPDVTIVGATCQPVYLMERAND